MTILAEKDSFISGDEIWFIAPTDSAIFHRLNWLMNFQLSKALKHESPQLPDKIQNILNKCELKSYNFIEHQKSSAQPILISAVALLPTKWVVLLEKNSDLREWSHKISQTWSSLNVKTARVFLPPGTATKEFQQALKNNTDFKNLTLVTQ